MAVASVVPAKWWRWRLALALASSFPVSLSLTGVLVATTLPASAAERARATSAGVTLAVSDTYDVNVPAGSWVPVAVTVVNHRASDLLGQVVVSVPVAQMNNGESCSDSGLGFVCGASFAPPTGYSSGAQLPEVTYRIPLSLAAGVSKQFVAYVLAESPYGNVQAVIATASGTVLAKAAAPLPVAYGTPQPAVLVVTQSPDAVQTMAALSTPTGSHPQLHYTVPADLPVSAAALGGFSAVTIDEADTSVLDPAQAMALEGYVDAGGTLVVAGGLDWRAATAGLPPGLLPASVEGLRSPMPLSGLASLLGARPTRSDVDLDVLTPLSGAGPTLTQGSIPLAVQAERGSGQVVLCAFDPLAAPLATWPGTTAMMSRVFAPAFQDGYFGEQPSVAVGPANAQARPRNLGAASITNIATGIGANGTPALLSPTTASQGLLGYLEQMPGASPPTAYVFGLLLAGYVLVVGPLCFWVLTRLRRRDLAWVAVPCLAVVGGLVLYFTGAGVQRRVVVNEVRVTQLAPGSHLAELISLGAVYLPRGGSVNVDLTGQFSSPPTLIGDLGADAGAQLAVGATDEASGAGGSGAGGWGRRVGGRRVGGRRVGGHFAAGEPDGARRQQLPWRVGRQWDHPSGRDANGERHRFKWPADRPGDERPRRGSGGHPGRNCLWLGLSGVGDTGPGGVVSSEPGGVVGRWCSCRPHLGPPFGQPDQTGYGTARGGSTEPLRPRVSVLEPGGRHPGAGRLHQPPPVPAGPRH